MSEVCCDICGIKAMEDQEFAEERIPFRRPKHYCPPCHQRFHQRLQLSFFGVAVFVLVLSLGTSLINGRSLDDSQGLFFSLLILSQWALTFPHELGHAVAGKLLGYRDIRIVVGAGKAVGSFRFSGFPWLINRVPFGGLTFANHGPHPARWKEIVFVAGGLGMNLLCLAAAWWWIEPGALFDGRKTAIEAFFWANALVVVENLFPYTVATAYGRMASDGKLLYEAIFRWGKPAVAEVAVPGWMSGALRLLKALGVMGLVVAGLVFGLVAGYTAVAPADRIHLFTKCWRVAFLAGLTVLSVQSALRLYRSGVPAHWKKSPAVSHAYEWVNELRQKHSPANLNDDAEFCALYSEKKYSEALMKVEAALKKHPADVVFLFERACSLGALDRFALAEAAWDDLFAALPLADDTIRAGVQAQKMTAVMLQTQIERFRQLIDEFVASPMSVSQKLLNLDKLACVPFMEDRPDLLEQGEFCARKALEIAPGQLTVMGTLGSIFVELGRMEEGEPLVRQCYDRSVAVQDKGICALYLARIAEARGDLSAADKLLKESLILHSEPWLVAKVKAAQERLRRRANHPVSLS